MHAFDHAEFQFEQRHSGKRHERISKHQQHGAVHRVRFVLVQFRKHHEWCGKHFCEQQLRDEYDGCPGGMYGKHSSGNSRRRYASDSVQRQQSGAINQPRWHYSELPFICQQSGAAGQQRARRHFSRFDFFRGIHSRLHSARRDAICRSSAVLTVTSVKVSDSRGTLVTKGPTIQPRPVGISRVSESDWHST